MGFNNKLYRNHPLHIYSHEVEKDILKLVIINVNKEKVTDVTISYQDIEYSFNVDSCETVIEKEVQIVSKNYVIEAPIILKANINDEKVSFNNDDSYIYIIQPKSIANMRDEKYLYIQKMVKYNGCKKENVRCNADQFRDYWHCTCGHVNLTCQDECIHCHIKKAVLFSHEIDNSIEEVKTRRIVSSNKYILWMEVILLFIQFSIVDLVMGGDMFFANENLNTFSAVFNRYVLPVIFTSFTIGLILARKRYIYWLETAFDIGRIVALAYLNIIVNIAFVSNSHTFVLFVGYNLIFIGLYISQLILKIQKIRQLITAGIATVLLGVGIGQAIHFNQYDMVVTTNGISLTIHENTELLDVQNEINNVKVSKIIFSDSVDYSNVKTLDIDENLQYIITSTPMNIPHLESINLSSNNPYLYIENEILFYSGGHTVCLVPATLEEIVVDWEVIQEASFSNCENLKKVTITKNVKTIDINAFMNCKSLETIVFEEGSNLTTINELAFYGCTSLKEIEIPKSVQKIGRGILGGCENLEKVSIPFTGEYRYTKDDSANQNIFGYTFGAGYNFNNFNLPKLKEVYITDQKLFQNVTFYKCPAEKIVIEGDSLLEGAYLGQNVFYQCENLKEFVVPEGITKIGKNCFKDCINLERIVLPSTLSFIDTDAFSGCTSLKEVIYSGGNLENIEIMGGNDAVTAFLYDF